MAGSTGGRRETPGRDEARARDDPMGLDILDATDIGGTWTVTGGEHPPPTAAAARRREPLRGLLLL